MKNQYTKHGPFHITSGKMVISDPCYDECDEINNGVLDVLNGNWYCLLEQDQEIKNLFAIHESFIDPNITDHIRIINKIDSHFQYQTKFNPSVDSGQIGFYDQSYFHLCHEDIYDNICDLVDQSHYHVGLFGFGAASYTLHGDGSYPCIYAKNKKGIYALKIILGYPEDEEMEEF